MGDLADLILIDTRTRGDEPIDGPDQTDPERSQLGPDQRAWFLGQVEASHAAWRLIGNSSVMGRDRHDERAVAVEFVTTSLTSQNVDDKMGWEPRTGSVPMERAWVDAVPYVKFADFDDHGYPIVDVTPERVRGEWWFIDAVREPTTGEHLGPVWEVRRGEPGLVPAG